MRFATVAVLLLLSSCFVLAAANLKEVKVLDKTEIKSIEFTDVNGATLNGKSYSFSGGAFVKITFTANKVTSGDVFSTQTAEYTQKAFIRGLKLKGSGTPPSASTISAVPYTLELGANLKIDSFTVEDPKESPRTTRFYYGDSRLSLTGSGILFVNKDLIVQPAASFGRYNNEIRSITIDLGGLAPAYYAGHTANSQAGENSFGEWILTDKIMVDLKDVEYYDFQGGLSATRLAKHVVREATEGGVPRLETDNVGGGYALSGVPIFQDALFYTLPETAATKDPTGRLEMTPYPGENAKLYCTARPLLDETQLLAEYALGALTGKDACAASGESNCFQSFLSKFKRDYGAADSQTAFNYQDFFVALESHKTNAQYAGVVEHLGAAFITQEYGYAGQPSKFSQQGLDFKETALSQGANDAAEKTGAFQGGKYACYLRFSDRTFGDTDNPLLFDVTDAGDSASYYYFEHSDATTGAKLDAVDLATGEFSGELATVNYGVAAGQELEIGGSAISIALITDDGYSVEANGLQPVKYAYSQLAEPAQGALLALSDCACPSGGACSCQLVGAPVNVALAQNPGDDYYASLGLPTPAQARVNCDNIEASGSGTFQDDNGLTLTTADPAAVARYSQTASVEGAQTASLAGSTRVSANAPSGVNSNCPVNGECSAVIDGVTLEKFELLGKCPQTDALKSARSTARTDVCARFKGYVNFENGIALDGVTASSSFGVNPGPLSVAQNFPAQVTAPEKGSETGNIDVVFALPSYFKSEEDAKATFELDVSAKLGSKVCPTKGAFQLTYKTTAREEYLVYAPKFYDGKLHG